MNIEICILISIYIYTYMYVARKSFACRVFIKGFNFGPYTFTRNSRLQDDNYAKTPNNLQVGLDFLFTRANERPFD